MHEEFFPNEMLTPDFTERVKSSYEKYGLDLIITPAELSDECYGDPLCERALKDMLEYAVRYIDDVMKMKQFTRDKSQYTDEEWAEQFAIIDSNRTRLHNTYIQSVEILIRNMNKAEKNTEWAKKLMVAGKVERSICGKFAFMLSYWLSVNRRQ